MARGLFLPVRYATDGGGGSAEAVQPQASRGRNDVQVPFHAGLRRTVDQVEGRPHDGIVIVHRVSKKPRDLDFLKTRSHPEMVGDMSCVTLNFDLSKIPFVHF